MKTRPAKRAVPATLPAQAEELPRRGIIAAFAVQAVLLAYAASKNLHLLNTDAIAYLRIGSYYAEGNTALMVSGYWGPLLSWMLAPLLKMGVPPLAAARIVMAISAVIFTLGCLRLFARLELPKSALLVATWLAALGAVFWSVEYISPDLLLAGLASLAIAQALHPDWLSDRRQQILSGVWWGLAYLAKPVGLPLAFAVLLGISALWFFTRAAEPKRVARALGFSLLALLLVSGPWILTLSVKYDRPTFSTSGRINHAIVGPPEVERRHPFGWQFHQPEPGRLTAWEDPTHMPYRFWSPFDNRAYLNHQLKLIRENFETVIGILANFDTFALGVLSALGCLVLLPPWRERLARERWRWLVIPLAALGGIYLPVYVKVVDQRYFYLAFPLLLLAGLHLVRWISEKSERYQHVIWRGGLGLISLSFGLLILVRLSMALEGMPNPAAVAGRELAERITRANVAGPIAGSGFVQYQRAGLYTAFFLGQPWHGDQPDASPAEFKNAGTRLIVVRREEPIAAALERHADFNSLDPALFASPAEAAEFPLQVFESRSENEN